MKVDKDKMLNVLEDKVFSAWIIHYGKLKQFKGFFYGLVFASIIYWLMKL